MLKLSYKMATGYSTETPDLYTCQVCLEDMLQLNPRLLSCHHTFCEGCLKNLIRGQKISCPTCRLETPVPQGDVTKLTKDFRLLQIKEHMEEMATKPSSYCQLCKKSVASGICETCNKLICDICKDKHSKMKLFKNHNIQKLCRKHPESGISHICIKCVETVCGTCIFLDHSDHEDQIQAYKDGINSIKKHIKDSILRIQQMINSKTAEKQREQAIKVTINKTTRKLEIERKELERQIAEIDNKLKKEAQNEKNADQKIKESGELIKNYGEIEDKLRNLELSVSQGDIHDGNKIMEAMQKEFEIHQPRVLDLTYYREPVVSFRNIDKWVQNPQLVLDIDENSGFEMKMPVGIACSDQGYLFIADNKLPFVTKINDNSEVTLKIQTKKEHGKVVNVRTLGDVLYIGQENCITKHILSNPGRDTEEYHPDVTKMCDFDVVNEQMFIITEEEGCVCEYNTVTKLTKQVLVKEGVNRGIYITCVHCKEGLRFILSFNSLHRIEIYNRDWKLLTSISEYGSGSLYRPRSTCVTPNGFLVADWCNDRISYFNIDGQYKQRVVTKKDGLDGPWGLCYKAPFIWVTQYSTGRPGKVRCYLLSSK